MSNTHDGATRRLARQRTYRRMLFGSIFLGVALALVLRRAGYPIAAEAIYWLGVITALAIWGGTSMKLFDERDIALEQRTSQLTLYVIAMLAVPSASIARVGSQLEWFSVPPELWGGLYAYVLLFVVFGVTYLGLTYRP